MSKKFQRESKRKKQLFAKAHRLYGEKGRLSEGCKDNGTDEAFYANDCLVLSESFTSKHQEDVELLTGEIFVDVLRVWDFESQKWMEDTPIILRFETADLTVWHDKDGQVYSSLGAVKTELPIIAASEAMPDADNLNSQCIGWLSDWQMICFMGSEVKAFDAFHTNNSGLCFGLISVTLTDIIGYDYTIALTSRSDENTLWMGPVMY